MSQRTKTLTFGPSYIQCSNGVVGHENERKFSCLYKLGYQIYFSSTARALSIQVVKSVPWLDMLFTCVVA